MDSMIEKINILAGPMTKFGNLPVVQGITRGMMGSMGCTMIGSLFLVAYILAAPGTLLSNGNAVLPFLTPLVGKLVLVNSLSLGIIALYMAVAMGSEYAQIKGVPQTTGAVGALFAFILLNYDSVGALVDSGASAFDTTYWGGAGIITAIISMVVSVEIVDFCYKRDIRIKLPDSVPPAIANSFSSIIPYFIMALICWGVRTLAGINIPALVGQLLLPVLSAADNIFVYTLVQILICVFWSVGLHGDNITGAVTQTFTTIWFNENNAAYLAGQVPPHVWAGNISRLSQWVSSMWPILVYMYMSSKKLPHLKTLATVSLPPAIFCIIEPIMFGLPVVLNGFLIIPLILSHAVTGALTYALTASGFVGKQVISLPWCTPSPILGYVGGAGSIGGFLIVFINFAIGMVIFYPFWKAYEKSEVARMEAETNQAE